MRKAKLTEENRKTFLLALHKLIDSATEKSAQNVVANKVQDLAIYPPNGGFSTSEIETLKQIASIPRTESVLRKIIADANGQVIFNLLNFFDGTGDPDTDLGKWTGVALADSNQIEENNAGMLHDDFSESYWDWMKIRPKKDWKLDSLDS